MKTRSTLLVALTASLAMSSASMAGPDWTEDGDAGSTVQTAQVPLGEGQISSLSGRLGTRGGGDDFEDMYYIGVAQPTSFTLQLTSPNFDAQLFVFHITLAGGALGLLANDNADIETTAPRITPMATDGTGVVLDLPGIYLVAVAGAGRTPVSATGEIFNFETSTEISGADGPGGLNRHIGWVGEGATGDYRIQMDGTIFPDIPAPGSIALLAMGGLAMRRRR